MRIHKQLGESMHKGYTLNYLIEQVKNTTNTEITTNGIYNTLSPRAGVYSVKGDVLDGFLFHNTQAVVAGAGIFATYGKTPKTRLLKALKLRKTTGSPYGNSF